MRELVQRLLALDTVAPSAVLARKGARSTESAKAVIVFN